MAVEGIRAADPDTLGFVILEFSDDGDIFHILQRVNIRVGSLRRLQCTLINDLCIGTVANPPDQRPSTSLLKTNKGVPGRRTYTNVIVDVSPISFLLNGDNVDYCQTRGW